MGKFDCPCSDNGNATIDEACAVIEITMQTNNMCANMTFLAAARTAGCIGIQTGATIEELKEELMRQFEIGVADFQKLMQETGGNSVAY